MKHCAAIAILALSTLGAAQEHDATLGALVESEREFSRLSGRIGQVPAFLAYFADDVVTFQPAPVKGKIALRERAAAMPVPPTHTLDWEPWFADVSLSGDLGYTTGPFAAVEVSTGKAVRHGWYFSVWKRDAYGWRVAADIGISAPAVEALRPRALVAVPRLAQRPPRASIDGLLTLERQTSAKASEAGLGEAYAGKLADSVRLYREGLAPLDGAREASAYLLRQARPLGWQALEAWVSSAGDFACTYGPYNLRPADPVVAAKAAFLHVWKQGRDGWLLVADVVTE